MKRTFNRLALTTCACLVAFAVAVTGTAHAAGSKGHRGASCLPNVQGWLQEGGIDLESVDTININARTRTNNDGDRLFQGWLAWVRFKDREGAILFSMQRGCQLQSSGARGGIEWSGPGATCQD